ncbi:MAG TPA: cysteate synthase [Candidatus Sulfotelmatobacter sp.]|nr:cysteate synthase [Candidatus Sulfotelmatobacter sp.]
MKESPIRDLDVPKRERPSEKAAHYQLACPACGCRFTDDGWMLECPRSHSASLLTTLYSSRTLVCDETQDGLYRYRCWLPAANLLAGAAIPVTYKSARLSSILRLPNLWITFSGYWPERGARLETATFKELEAYGVLSRIPQSGSEVLVVASAGNSAAAFARICSENGIRCLIVVPASGMKAMQFTRPLGPSVKIVSLSGNADYSDAIALGDAVSRREGFRREGGVRNVGRRDGLGAAMLSAVETIGALPDYYFQAISSGAGAIAAHVAAKRLTQNSRFSRTLPRLMLSQNLPFTPILDSWRRGRREFIRMERSRARALTRRILASVLSNQRPPYAIGGGLFDVLKESQGDLFGVRNNEVLRAMRLFEECEEIDLDPAAGVALAALMQAVRSNRIIPGSHVLLHITGGGFRKRAAERDLALTRANLEIPARELRTQAAVTKACNLFRAPAAAPRVRSGTNK